MNEIQVYLNKINKLPISNKSKEIFENYIKEVEQYYNINTIRSAYNNISTFLRRTGIEPTEITPEILDKYLKERQLTYYTKESYKYHIGKFYYFAVKGHLGAPTWHWRGSDIG